MSAYLNNTPGITVSADNRAAIISAIEELNYTVNVHAKSVKTGRSHCIAVYGGVYNALLLQLVEGIQLASAPAGYHVLIYGEGHHPAGREGLVALYRQGRIDGIITLDFPDPLDPAWERMVQDSGAPYVSVEGIPAPGSRISSVQTDYRASVRDALEFMRRQTSVPPVYLNMLPSGRMPTDGDQKRLAAYLEWMDAHGLAPDVVETEDGGFSAQEQWWREWLEARVSHGPLSILANWSRAALSVYRTAYDKGLKIGKDLFVMSADDTERVSRHMVPPVPCIEVPYGEMGRQAFLMLRELMDRPEGGEPLGLADESKDKDAGPKTAVQKQLVGCRLYDGRY